MDDPTGDIRAGAPRVPRVRRNKKEEQAHVRDVLVALGGSPDEFDRAHDQSDGSATLDSRVAPYTRFASTATAPTPTAPAPAVTPPTTAPIAAPRPERRQRPVRRDRPALGATLGRAGVAAVRMLARSASRVARVLALALTHLVALLRAALAWSVPRARHAVRLFAHLVVRCVRKLALALTGAAAALRRSLPPLVAAVRRFVLAVGRAGASLKRPPKPVRRRDEQHEPVHVADAVSAWVQPLPARTAKPPRQSEVEPHAESRTITFPVLQAPRRRAFVSVLGAVRRFALAVGGAGAALKRPPKPVRRRDEQHEPVQVAEAVNAWVHPEPARPSEVESPAAEPLQAPTADRGPGRERRVSRKGVIILAVVIVAVSAAVLVPMVLDQGNGAPTRAAASAADLPQSVPSRSEFSDPGKYAAAMTQLALRSGRTEIDGDITCAGGSTWKHWSCQARGKPAFGAYAGQWLTYRCSPNATPQPGGRPDAVMINCSPQNTSAG